MYCTIFRRLDAGFPPRLDAWSHNLGIPVTKVAFRLSFHRILLFPTKGPQVV
jgi:hypothetical protein